MNKWLYVSLLTGLILSGCAKNQVQVDSQVMLPLQFDQTDMAKGSAEIAQWWQNWNDPVLNRLIEQGLTTNHELKVALENLQAARSTTQLAEADLKPALGANAGVSAHQFQLDNPLNSDVKNVLSQLGSSLGDDNFNFNGHAQHMGFIASWELDIFGQKKSDVDAARYASLATMQQWYGAQMLVASDIAQNYFTVRSLQQRIKIGDHTVATLQQLKRYAQGRFRAGQITDYDVKDVDAKLTAVQAQLATLQAQADAYQRNIAVLTGQVPQGFKLAASPQNILQHIPAPPQGQRPLQILNRRPDIQAKQAVVQAYSAKRASAQADLLPRFNMQFFWQTGQLSLDSDLPDLKGYGGLVSAGMTLPIFTAGRIHHNIEISDHRLQAALADYDHAVLKALAEVDSSYQLQFALSRQNLLLAQALHKANQQAKDASTLYRYGQMTLDRALSARLTANELADKQVQGKLAQAQNLLDLYKTLGGGWQSTQSD